MYVKEYTRSTSALVSWGDGMQCADARRDEDAGGVQTPPLVFLTRSSSFLGLRMGDL